MCIKIYLNDLNEELRSRRGLLIIISNCIEQSPSSDVSTRSASQEIPALMDLVRSIILFSRDRQWTHS